MRLKHNALSALLAGIPLIFGGCATTRSSQVEASKGLDVSAPLFEEVNRLNFARYEYPGVGNYVNAVDFTSSKPESPLNHSTYNAFGPVFFTSKNIEDAVRDDNFFDSYLHALNRARRIIPHVASRSDSSFYVNPEPVEIMRPRLEDIEVLDLGKVVYEFDGSGVDPVKIEQTALIGLYNAARKEVSGFNEFVYMGSGDAELSSPYDPNSRRFRLGGANKKAVSRDIDAYGVSEMKYDSLENGRIRATGNAYGVNFINL